MKIKLPRRYHRVGVAIHPPRHPVGGEFDRYQKKNYQFEPVNCLCGVKNSDYVISTVDREGWKYKLVACQSCGLIRASDYWDEYSLADFYSNWYRESGESDVNSFYARQANRSASVKNFVEQHTSDFKKRYVVFDIGGGAGGILDSFRNDARCYLVDYDISFFKKAESMGISTQRGGINDLENIIDQPDLVILSHVLEHFTDVNQKIEDLTSRLRIGALVYIELPGIDSLCEGRRKHDFLGDIRATGDVSQDRISFMERCGVNEFVLNPQTDLDQALEAFTEISVQYQPTVDKNPVIAELRNYRLAA